MPNGTDVEDNENVNYGPKKKLFLKSHLYDSSSFG